jgi:hypothetical protein
VTNSGDGYRLGLKLLTMTSDPRASSAKTIGTHLENP